MQFLQYKRIEIHTARYSGSILALHYPTVRGSPAEPILAQSRVQFVPGPQKMFIATSDS